MSAWPITNCCNLHCSFCCVLLLSSGGGKTTLLKAIAGHLSYALDLQGKPMKQKPHISGRIEYNGVTKEVGSSFMILATWYSGAMLDDPLTAPSLLPIFRMNLT